MQIVGGYKHVFDANGKPRPLALRKEDFMELGEDVCVWPQAKIVNSGLVSIGHRTIIDDFVLIIAGEKPVVIGSFVHIASFCSITGRGGFMMEDFAGFAAGVRVATSDEDYAGGSCLTNPTIPATTNGIEGFFSHLKNHLDIHRGLTLSHRIGFIRWYVFLSNEK